MQKLTALVGRMLPSAAAGGARKSALGTLSTPSGGTSVAGPVDTFDSRAATPSDLLGLQVETDRATLRALVVSNLLAASHRTAMNILHNIGH